MHESALVAARAERVADCPDTEVALHHIEDDGRFSLALTARLPERHALTGKVLEVQAEQIEVRPPALRHLRDELALPVRADTEGAACHAHDTRPARRRFDEELGHQRRDVGVLASNKRGPVRLFVLDAPRRIPAGDGAVGRRLAHVERHRATQALFEVGRQEPTADAVGSRDRIPHLLGRARELDGELHAVGNVGRGHVEDSCVASGVGCAAITRRCGRPSSWW